MKTSKDITVSLFCLMLPNMAFASGDPIVVYILLIAVILHISLLFKVLLAKNIESPKKKTSFVVFTFFISILWAGVLATRLPHWLVCIVLLALPIVVFELLGSLTKRL